MTERILRIHGQETERRQSMPVLSRSLCRSSWTLQRRINCYQGEAHSSSVNRLCRHPANAKMRKYHYYLNLSAREAMAMATVCHDVRNFPDVGRGNSLYQCSRESGNWSYFHCVVPVQRVCITLGGVLLLQQQQPCMSTSILQQGSSRRGTLRSVNRAVRVCSHMER